MGAQEDRAATTQPRTASRQEQAQRCRRTTEATVKDKLRSWGAFVGE